MLHDNANSLGVVTEVALPSPPTARVIRARAKYLPVLANPVVRIAISLSLAAVLLRNGLPTGTLAVFVLAWIAGVLLADKYVHKYPYRYFPYLIASHLKATAVTAVILWLVNLVTPLEGLTPTVWRALLVMGAVDVLLSLPRRRLSDEWRDHGVVAQQANAPPVDTAKRPEAPPRSPAEIIAGLPEDVRIAMGMLLGQPGGRVVAVSDGEMPSSPVDVLAITGRLNDVRRINRLLLACTAKLNPGGYIVCAYRPLENESLNLLQSIVVFVWHRACPKIPIVERVYFTLTRGKNRRLSRAEVWGRLAFCGHKVVLEREEGGVTIVVARQNAPVVVNRRPSYYPVVGLTKVGLDGGNLITHKIRSMFPFSEFIQKQVFESNGLAAAGKISNDFRVTSYGRYLRRYWLDELPQLFDWLHGDIKLVGMRATSHHFLGLYPREFIDLYVQVKPGLIPPLFNEKTAGFAEIVKVEQQYLQAYLQKPVQTDLVNLYRTLRDIALRGVRSN